MTVRNLVDEAKKLTHAEQAELLDELIRLVGPESGDLDLTPAQAIDLAQRIDEYRSGKAELIDEDEAFDLLRRREDV